MLTRLVLMLKLLKISLIFLSIIIILVVIYFSYLVMDEMKFQRRKKELKDKEIEKLRETLSPYEFECTQRNSVNKSFNFMGYFSSGDYLKVIKSFKDYYGFTHQVGEKFYFASAYFLTYEDGYTLYISDDKINVSTIYLQNRIETQKEICSHPEEYFKILEQGRFKREVF